MFTALFVFIFISFIFGTPLLAARLFYGEWGWCPDDPE